MREKCLENGSWSLSSFHGLKCVGDEPLTVCSRDPKGSPSRRVVCCWSPVFLVVVPAAGLEALQDRCRFVSRTRELAAFTLWWKAGLHTHLLYLLAETRGAPRASVFILGGGGIWDLLHAALQGSGGLI